MRNENEEKIVTLISAIGETCESPHLQKLFTQLNIKKNDLKRYPFNLPGRRLWADDSLGLQLDFKDIGLLKNIPYHDLDEGPWILTKVIFWGSRKKKTPYTGLLPYNLNFEMPRKAAEEKLFKEGLEKIISPGLANEVDIWNLNKLELTIEYFEGDNTVRCIAIGIPINRTEI